jgi:glycine/D-amino acid oxidase-like deaminating enzyme
MATLAGPEFRRVGSLYTAASEEEVEAGQLEHDALRKDGFTAEWVDRNDLPPLLRPRFLAGLFHAADGAIHPGRWARRLAALAAEEGAALSEQTRATALSGTEVGTERGTVTAEQVVVATDGYTYGLVPELDQVISPARAQMLATEPLRGRYFDSVIAIREGWDYWQQTADGRLLIGGRRDTELEREFTREDEPTSSIQGRIEEFARALVPEELTVTHRWAGLLGFTPDRLPLVGALPGRPGVWASLGYSGHGNVLALACGEGVARALLGRADPRLEPLSPGRILAAPAPA